ncbi:hypothetical protein DBV14_06085 [Variovorax sp. KBW07]|uniref:outer membrane protein assembly factor BamE n=1 Tax=Variovorax sp. KBW07 TaxID=2153358 RepID=UPI000F56FD8C|nr:outer membrane protein assembly factor BamE [Variovorax sp. KBW07]RQO61072.1 hypothetical protein DBV14_06085 [Variovorax sp. KBW07]
MTYEQRHAQRQEQPRQHPRRATATLAAIGAIALFALQGCTSYVSSGLADDGKSAATLVWPDIEAQASRKEGSFPNRDNLRAIGPGATKDQLYELIGRPHFAEGMAGVREWDYVFKFRSGGGITPCRYKVIFDTNYRAQGFYWHPAACAKLAAQGG